VQDSVVLGQALHCESCHGPGSAHVAADSDPSEPGFATMRRFDKMPPKEANAFCTRCHSTGEQFYWQSSSHARKDITCVTCHSMHEPKDPGHAAMLKTENKSEMCLKCHKMKRMDLARSAHMPLTEGGMDCADCHNPHGSSAPHQIRAASVNELCTSCHMDKRGPFLWEHPPVRENCVTCHEPHGANNDKVLTGKRPFLCQRCHVATRHPSTLYDNPDLASNRLFNRSCNNCHSQIHGSNHPSGKFYLR
jgi:DmsE family decaheme c-type cytochrome